VGQLIKDGLLQVNACDAGKLQQVKRHVRQFPNTSAASIASEAARLRGVCGLAESAAYHPLLRTKSCIRASSSFICMDVIRDT
jgi:hypothetical protein